MKDIPFSAQTGEEDEEEDPRSEFERADEPVTFATGLNSSSHSHSKHRSRSSRSSHSRHQSDQRTPRPRSPREKKATSTARPSLLSNFRDPLEIFSPDGEDPKDCNPDDPLDLRTFEEEEFIQEFQQTAFTAFSALNALNALKTIGPKEEPKSPAQQFDADMASELDYGSGPFTPSPDEDTAAPTTPIPNLECQELVLFTGPGQFLPAQNPQEEPKSPPKKFEADMASEVDFNPSPYTPLPETDTAAPSTPPPNLDTAAPSTPPPNPERQELAGHFLRVQNPVQAHQQSDVSPKAPHKSSKWRRFLETVQNALADCRACSHWKSNPNNLADTLNAIADRVVRVEKGPPEEETTWTNPELEEVIFCVTSLKHERNSLKKLCLSTWFVWLRTGAQSK